MSWETLREEWSSVKSEKDDGGCGDAIFTMTVRLCVLVFLIQFSRVIA